ncbi:hypothetical protein OAZ80_01650 [bacterium]|nr:hypothetical protein [bacterium]
MSLLDDIYGDDNRAVIEIATDISSPNRVARSWVKHRIEGVISQSSTQLTDEQIEAMTDAFQRKGLL